MSHGAQQLRAARETAAAECACQYRREFRVSGSKQGQEILEPRVREFVFDCIGHCAELFGIRRVELLESGKSEIALVLVAEYAHGGEELAEVTLGGTRLADLNG